MTLPFGGGGGTDSLTAEVPFGTDVTQEIGRFVFYGGEPITFANVEVLDASVSPPAVPVPPQDFPADANEVAQCALTGGVSVTVFEGEGQTFQFEPFSTAQAPGGVRATLADVNGDGVPDIVAAAGAGTSGLVRVFDGLSGLTMMELSPFEPGFTGGLFVAAGDLNSDGLAEIIVTPDEGGGPRVVVFDGDTGGRVADFFGIEDPAFRGGARAAVGDIDGDGRTDLVVAAGFTGGPRVALFDGRFIVNTPARNTPTKLADDFFVFEESQRGGAFVTAGDFNGDGLAEVVAGGGPNGGPRVTALDGADLLIEVRNPIFDFSAGPAESRSGVRVAAKEFADGEVGLVASNGEFVRRYVGDDLEAGNTTPLSELAVGDSPDDVLFVG